MSGEQLADSIKQLHTATTGYFDKLDGRMDRLDGRMDRVGRLTNLEIKLHVSNNAELN